MLKKLLKYDFKSCLFPGILMYGVFIAIAGYVRLAVGMADAGYSVFHNDVFSAMAVVSAVFLYILGCGAVMVLTFLMIARRFYSNLMGREGYLSFTLPVTAGAHLASKMIWGVIFLCASNLILALSVAIVTAGTGVWSRDGMEFFSAGIELFKINHLPVLILNLIKGFVGLVEAVAVIYVSVCIGQLASGHRILASIGTYIGIIFVLNMIGVLGSTIFINLLENETGSVFYYTITGVGTILYRCAAAAGSLAGSVLLMKHRLNLE